MAVSQGSGLSPRLVARTLSNEARQGGVLVLPPSFCTSHHLGFWLLVVLPDPYAVCDLQLYLC